MIKLIALLSGYIVLCLRLLSPSAEQLTQWVDDVLDAITLDDLFKMFGKKELWRTIGL